MVKPCQGMDRSCVRHDLNFLTELLQCRGIHVLCMQFLHRNSFTSHISLQYGSAKCDSKQRNESAPRNRRRALVRCCRVNEASWGYNLEFAWGKGLGFEEIGHKEGDQTYLEHVTKASSANLFFELNFALLDLWSLQFSRR